MIRRFDHVLHAGRFADEHAGRIVLFQDRVERGDLRVDVVAGRTVFGVDQQ